MPKKIKRKKQLLFKVPGEYYLRINGLYPLRVLILDPKETISQSVLRIFDFSVANLVFCDGNGADWRRDPKAFLDQWFNKDSSAALLCGPTSSFFRALVEDRLRLPTRKATFPGIYSREGKILQSVHTVPEVYLPDIGRFVMFDINNALVVRWLGAMDIARLINERLDDRALLTASEFAKLNLDIYPNAPQSYKPVSFACNPKQQMNFSVGTEALTQIPISRDWVEDPTRGCPVAPCWIATWFFGGVAYFKSKEAGTDFLQGYTYASLHKNPKLTEAAVEWAETFGLHPVIVVSEDELRRELDQGFAQQIQAKPWLNRLPQTK